MYFIEVDNIFDGENILGKNLTNKMDFLELADIGITMKSLSNLTKHFSLSTKQIASLLPISEKTLKKYTPDQHLNKYVSEQAIHIANVMVKGTEVFEDKQKLLLWLNTPHIIFSGNTPFSLLTSRFGIELVLDELGRIEHGVYP